MTSTANLTGIFLAMLVAALFGLINTIDKTIIRKFVNPEAATIFVCLSGIIPTILVFSIGFDAPPFSILLLSMLIGALFTIFVYCYFHALYNADTDIVIAILQVSAIFSLIIGASLFEEVLTPLTLGGALVLIAGIASLSLHRSYTSNEPHRAGQLAWKYALLSAILLSIGMSAQKYSLAYASEWAIFAWGRVGGIIMAFLILFRQPKLGRQLGRYTRRYRWKILIFVMLELIYYGTIIIRILAIKKGPFSIVAVIVTSQPLFVTVFSFVQDKLQFLQTNTPATGIRLRLIFVLIIVSGAAMIALGENSR